jgi:TPR repeat protein
MNAATQKVEEARRLLSEAPPKYSAAYDALLAAANGGSPEAQYALGTWHLHGTYVVRDVMKAVAYLRMAADQDFPSALFDLAVCYETGVGIEKSDRAAFELYLRAALAGDLQASFEVGRCWRFGVGIAADERLAEVWFEEYERRGGKEA